jgi:AcrR family transcriptional regulator
MVEAVSRFRAGSQQRGEDTRRRILDAALELFAADGFEGASTRTLAERAGVNLPAIQYYFGSKEGLYAAVLEQITQRTLEKVGPVAARIRAELASGEPSRGQLISLLSDMLDVIILLILDETVPNREGLNKFFARLEIERMAAIDVLHNHMVRDVLEPCAAVIGRLTNRPPEDEQALLRAMTIIGQAKIFCSWGTSRVLGWESITEDRVRSVQAVVREHIQAIFSDLRGG